MKLISSTYMRICQSTKGNVNAKERLSLLKVRLQTDQISKDIKQKRTTKIRDLKRTQKFLSFARDKCFVKSQVNLNQKLCRLFSSWHLTEIIRLNINYLKNLKVLNNKFHQMVLQIPAYVPLILSKPLPLRLCNCIAVSIYISCICP